MDIIQVITQELHVEKWQVEAAVKLIDEGNTIPFISRYRKEATGALNDEQLRSLHERLTYLRNLEDKKAQVMGSIADQGKLTEELKKQIQEAQTLVVVEDLYRPYRPKRRTRAIIAKEKGLEPLANIFSLQMTDKTPEQEARHLFPMKKKYALCRKQLTVQWIFWQSVFPMKRITAFIFEILQPKREPLFLLQRIKRRSLFMRCTMSLRNR